MNSDKFFDDLEREAPRLKAFLEKEGSGLLRFETVEDLYQQTQLRVIKARNQFTDQGPGSLEAWLYTLARRTIADRHAYWTALKRNCGVLLRLSYGASTAGAGQRAKPASPDASPGTWASRRELLILATRALAVLPERDREIITAHIKGQDLQTLAISLGLGIEAAKKARSRALERLKKAFLVLKQHTH